MSKDSIDRARIRKFLDYDDIIDRPFWFLPLGLIQIALIVGGGVWFAMYDRAGRPDIMGYNVLEGVLAGTFLLILLGTGVYLTELFFKSFQRSARKASLKNLEANAREVFRTDYKRAMKAILRAARVQPNDLREVSRTLPVPWEKHLFSDQEISAFLGPLESQSLRAVIPNGTNPEFVPLGNSRLTGENYFNALCTPFRVICIFYTEQDLFVGEAVCDPMTGKIQRRVRPIPRDDLDATEFVSSQSTLPISRKHLDAWLRNRRLDAEERVRIRKSLARHDRLKERAKRYNQFLPELPFSFAQKLTSLEIHTRTGQRITLPLMINQTLVEAPATPDRMEAESFTSTEDDFAFAFEDENTDPLFGGGSSAGETALTQHQSALWSSGRQAKHREFGSVGAYVRSLLFAVMLGVASLFLMTAVTSDWTEHDGSSEETPVRTEPR